MLDPEVACSDRRQLVLFPGVKATTSCGGKCDARGKRKDCLVTTRSVREIALGLPGVEESRVGRQVRYRVAARRFATCPRGRRLLLLRLSSREQQVLTQVRPTEFSRAPHHARGWTRVDLRRVDPWLLEELLVAAWRRVATLRRVADWDTARATAAPPGQRTPSHGRR